MFAVLVGLCVWLGLQGLSEVGGGTGSILSWDAACLTFIVGMFAQMAGKGADHIRDAALRQDVGQGLILTLVLVACVASLASVGAQIGNMKALAGLGRLAGIGLVGVTVAESWFMVQLVFALHYAHEYYSVQRPGGLLFPGGEDPDYWDFLHFSVVIGVAAQTADIAFVSKPMRRLGTIHSATAFIFNTVILALSINLLASFL